MRSPEDRERLWAAISAERPRLLRLARARSATIEDAEDCVHEAMLRCAEFDGLDEDRLAPFLTTVTIRLCADRHRARTHDERLGRRLAAHAGRDEPAPDEVVCDRAEARWLAERFRGLPPRQQDIVRARAAGLSCAEVADRLRMSYSAVESQLSRARAALRGALASSLALLAVLVRHRRWAAVGAGAATISAAAVVAPVLLGPAAQPPAAAPARPEVRFLPEARTTEARPPAAPPAAPVVRAPARRPAHPARTAPAAPAPDRRRGQRIVGDDETGVEFDERHGEYSTLERVEHCITYGIDIDPNGTTQCRYPPEKETES